jgi:acetolactate synthase-1/2/3 large subunit
MQVSDYVAAWLAARRVTHVFELAGGMIACLLDALHRAGRIGIVSMHHEQGAGFAADGYARVAGAPGVAMATSGPGATNLLTAIGSCHFDSTAAVFITGQVNRHELKGDRPIRQLGFQETDIVAMARPVTKGAWLADDPVRLPALLDQAFALAMAGRPGPVLIDIPMDVQRADIHDLSRLDAPPAAPPAVAASGAAEIVYASLLNAGLAKAQAPLILAGGGLNTGRAVGAFRVLVDRLRIPVVHSLMAVDALPADHPCRVGLIGSYGNRWANLALGESDLLLVLGSRLDVRQTGVDTETFKRGRAIFHIDIDAGEMNNRVKPCTTWVSDLGVALTSLASVLAPQPDRHAWRARVAGLTADWPDTLELAATPGINPNIFCHALSRHAGSAAAFVVDVGQHQMWAAQSLDLTAAQRFITSGGMGAMGFALPAGIGVAFATGKPVVVIAGDGGFQINIQELQTVVRNRLPIKMIVVNNQCLGMVRQFQESFLDGRLQSTVLGAPRFAALAAAYGIAALRVTDPAHVEAALAACWADPTAPFLLEVMVATAANAYPKMAYGKPLTEMEPLARPLEMEAT